MMGIVVQSLSHVQLFATPWTAVPLDFELFHLSPIRYPLIPIKAGIIIVFKLQYYRFLSLKLPFVCVCVVGGGHH